MTWETVDSYNLKIGEKMKNYTQVYVKNSFEAGKMYCKAFGVVYWTYSWTSMEQMLCHYYW